MCRAGRPGRAAPQGAQVVRGNARVTRDGPVTSIQAGNNSIIRYRSFDVAAGEQVQFILPGPDARVLNRISGVAPSRIDGTLTANGRVYLVNPSGVIFGPTSVVNAAGLVAAAGNLSDQDFLAGADRFTGLRGPVSNAGTIQAGVVSLVGERVANSGAIVADDAVTMVAGQNVYLGRRDGQIFVQVAGPTPGSPAATAAQPAVQNAGAVQAKRGRVFLGAGDMYSVALTNTGTIRAKDIEARGGRGGAVTVSGTLDASDRGPGQAGGTVKVLGERVALCAAAIDASGSAGGGTVLVGGNFHGDGPDPYAKTTYASGDTTIRADALVRGDGGNVAVWSDLTTAFGGTATARGGPAGGNGGAAEVSGRAALAFAGRVDLSAPRGAAGTLTLDPANITIQSTTPGGPGDALLGPDGAIAATDGSGDVTVSAAALQAVTGNISLAATNDIIVATGTTLSLTNQGPGESVTFTAGNNVTINGPVTRAGASLTLNSGGSFGSVSINAAINTGGNVAASGPDFRNFGGPITTGGGNVTIASTGVPFAFIGQPLNTGGGNVDIAGTADVRADITTAGGTVHLGQGIDTNGTAFTINTTGTTLDGDIRLDAGITTGGEAGPTPITLNAGTRGAVAIAGDVGAGSEGGVGPFSVTGGTVSLRNVTTQSNSATPGVAGITVTAPGGITLAGNLTTQGAFFQSTLPIVVQPGPVALNGPVVLASDVTISTVLEVGNPFPQVAIAPITINGSINAAAAAGPRLIVDARGLLLQSSTPDGGTSSQIFGSNVTITGNVGDVRPVRQFQIEARSITLGGTTFRAGEGGVNLDADGGLTSGPTATPEGLTIGGTVSTSGSPVPGNIYLSTFGTITLANDLTLTRPTSTGPWQGFGVDVLVLGPVVGGHDLTIGAGDGLVDLRIQPPTGGSPGIRALTVTSTNSIDLPTAGLTTSGPQTYNGPVVLVQPVVGQAATATFTSTGAGNVTFNGAIAESAAGPVGLVVNTSGVTTFGDEVGVVPSGTSSGFTTIASLTTDASGATVIAGPAVRTSGPQTFNDPVTLAGDVGFFPSFDTTVRFGSTVNGVC